MRGRTVLRRLSAGFLPAVLVGALLTWGQGVAAAATTVETVTTGSVYGCLRTNGAGLYDATANKTFVSYAGTNHDIYLKAYDHTSNTWSAAVKVATLNLTDDNAYHDYPVLTQLSDGRLTIFRAQHLDAAWLYTAPTAHSITGAWSARRISTDKNTYLEPVVVGATIYLFYSQNTDLSHPYRTYRLIRSTDAGSTWSAPQTVIDSGRAADRYAEVYAFGVTRRDNRIFLTWSMHGGPKGHNGGGKNIYVAYFDTADSTMHSVAGTGFGTTVDSAELSRTSVVTTNPTDLAAGRTMPEENPVTVQLTDGTVVLGYGLGTASSSRIVLAKYTGGSWSSTTVDTGTSLFKDLVASGTSVEIVYASNDRKRLVSRRWTPAGGDLATRFDVAIPYSGGANTVFYADFVENRSTLSVIASTIDEPNRKTTDTGRWPVFAIRV